MDFRWRATSWSAFIFLAGTSTVVRRNAATAETIRHVDFFMIHPLLKDPRSRCSKDYCPRTNGQKKA